MTDPLQDSDKLFANVPLLLVELAKNGRIERYKTGVVVAQEGRKDDTLHIILAGRVKVFDNNEDGQEIVYGTFGAGHYFGEMTLDGGPRSASVAALEPTTCSVLSRAAVRDYVRNHGDFAFELIVTLIGRVRNASQIARDMTLVSVYGRLVLFISRNAKPQTDGLLVVNESLTQADIATRIGSSREMVSRILKDWEREGYIRINHKRIVVLKPLPERR